MGAPDLVAGYSAGDFTPVDAARAALDGSASTTTR